MSEKKIISMLKDVVAEVDYDIYKNLFIDDCMEDPDSSDRIVTRLIQIVKKYV